MGCRKLDDSPFHLQQESDGPVKKPPEGIPKDKVYLFWGGLCRMR